MQRTLIRLFRVLPLGVLYGCMALVIPFYMLFSKGFRASYSFFRKRLKYNALKSFVHVYLNEFSFGQVVLDRFAAFAGKKFEMEVPRMDLFQELCAGRDGFIQLSSHVGNYEMVGYSLVSPKRINALVYGGETATVMENRAALFGQTNVRMVPVSEDMSHIFVLNSALADGEIASVPGDRVFGSQKTVECLFLGKMAKFPAGPFVLAVKRDVPVLTVFVMKVGRRKYKVLLDVLPEPESESAQGCVLDLADAYASHLETVVRMYPDQWYNFYDFWK
jgi:predicted LPLAT superfamily acyltransferase